MTRDGTECVCTSTVEPTTADTPRRGESDGAVATASSAPVTAIRDDAQWWLLDGPSVIGHPRHFARTGPPGGWQRGTSDFVVSDHGALGAERRCVDGAEQQGGDE